MSSTYKKLENSQIKLTFKIEPDIFSNALDEVYQRQKGRINMQGFRKGKVPRKVIEATFGSGYFYEDAINHVLGKEYEKATTEANLWPVSQAEFEIVEVTEKDGATLTATFTVRPDFDLKKEDYAQLEYPRLPESIVTDEDLEKTLEEIRKQNSRLVPVEDRAAKQDDVVTINFEGFIDGEAFEGGKSDGYRLKLGSKQFIDNFEEQLIGKNIGDNVEVHVTFPEKYPQENLSGKAAIFNVKMLEINETVLPELDDDFAEEISEFDTLEEYTKDVRAKLEVQREQMRASSEERRMLDALARKIPFDLPEVMIENQVNNMIQDFSNRLRQSGMSMEAYLTQVGQTIENLRKAYRKTAELQIRARVILEKIAEVENFEVTEAEITAEVHNISEMYNTPYENLMATMRDSDKRGLILDIKSKKAMDLLVSNSRASKDVVEVTEEEQEEIDANNIVKS
ncbi:MAG: trigger factor [Defluviitaleaceae bacterium]|nr:trigger factor [Defluviitaleaceae bacterium]